MADLQALSTLIDSPTRLAVIETAAPAVLIDWLRQRFKDTGQASYVWSPQQGLQRISIEHIPIPQTDRPLEVLAHILASHHYGIYLLCDFQAALKERAVIDKLQHLMNDVGAAHKRVLLVGTRYHLPTAIANKVAHLSLS